MEILLLSPHLHLIERLENHGDRVVQTTDKIDVNFVKGFDWIISYGYRHIIKPEVIKAVKACNLHLSYLPWNRGADPNLWSFLDDTPKGYTIHYIDSGLDTGYIIFQREFKFDENETLATTYNLLSRNMEEDFLSLWPLIRETIILSKPQNKNEGSYHRSKDKEPYMHLLHSGWDTPIKDIILKGAELK